MLAALLGGSVAFSTPPTFTNPFASLFAAAAPDTSKEENGLDEQYPWRFDGRFWFRPAIVPMPATAPPEGLTPIGLFGYTLGGVVCLEYDESPVGPYIEYVTMGALVSKRGALGQWGSRLFVSTDPAEEVCVRTWDVPAEVATMTFDESSDGPLCVDAPPQLVAGSGGGRETIRVNGWASTQHNGDGEVGRFGGVPVLWTPSTKTLWAPFVPLPPPSSSAADADTDADAAPPGLPLHQLRLSASSLRLHLCGQPASDQLGLPSPIGFSVDGLRIENARAGEKPL